VVIFGLGSGLGGAAPDFAVLLVARVLQGVGGALLAPAALATVTVTFVDPKERATGFGVFGAIGAVGGALGLLLGGVLTEHVDWRSTLFVNLGIAAVTLVGALAVIDRDVARERKRLDVLGTVLVSVGVFALVFGFSRAQTNGWGAVVTLVSLGASAILLSVFAWWQTRASNPLLPLRVLLDRDRGASLSALMLANVGMFAVFLFLTYYLQLTLHYSPVRTGLAFMPLIGGTIAGAGIGLQFLPRFTGPRFIVPSGMLIAAACLAWLTRLGLHTGYWGGNLPAAAHSRSRNGADLPARHQPQHRPSARRRQRRRWSLGQHHPTGRRVGRDRAAEHPGRQRSDRLSEEPPRRPGGRAYARDPAQLRGCVLDRRGHLRRRRRHHRGALPAGDP
jgi:MFS family permease